MSAFPGSRPRPEILDVVAIASFVLSALTVVWLLVIGVLVLLVGAGSWLAGPAVGAIGATLAGVVLVLLLLHSGLTILLFVAAWKTWRGQPEGRSLHLTWAWIIVVVDLIDVAFTGGMEPGAWVRLIYAVFVIFVMGRDEVRAYFDAAAYEPHLKPPAPQDWA